MKRFFIRSCLLFFLSAGLCGCGQEKTEPAVNSEFAADSEYVKEKGTLLVGVTDFEPLDYLQDGEWIGFDAEMAGRFADSLGVLVQFLEIDWDKRLQLLEDGTIDCIWNGMTLSEEGKKEMACSMAYLNNAQMVVVPEENAENLKTAEDCMHLLFAVEAGSAGEEKLKERNYRYVSAGTQKGALSYVEEGKADAAVIDAIMAGALLEEGKQFADLVGIDSLGSEEFGVGFRKGSDLAGELDIFWQEAEKDGTVDKTAEKYGVQAALISAE